MWTVVYMTQSMDDANTLKELLEEEGILVKLRPVSQSINSNKESCEILVSETEVDEAHSIIIENGY